MAMENTTQEQLQKPFVNYMLIALIIEHVDAMLKDIPPEDGLDVLTLLMKELESRANKLSADSKSERHLPSVRM